MNLCKRLRTVGGMIAPGSRVADVGTDHAKLPVWLVQQGIAPSCIACDIGGGPLQRAKQTVEQEGMSDAVSLCLCDGLTGIDPDAVDTVVIAGMGGEMIIKILSESPWCREKQLVLQPMTATDKLRVFLAENGFAVQNEAAVFENQKAYAVLDVCYNGVKRDYPPEYPYIGTIAPGTPDADAYLARQQDKLYRMKCGLERSDAPLQDEIERLEDLLSRIQTRRTS